MVSNKVGIPVFMTEVGNGHPGVCLSFTTRSSAIFVCLGHTVCIMEGK